MTKENDMPDLNKDGVLDKEELSMYRESVIAQRKMAFAALFAILASGAYIIGFVDNDRLDGLRDILDMYWITLGGIIAAHMGAEAWVTKRKPV